MLNLFSHLKLALDEAHKAKNYASKKTSAVGMSVVKFQAQLPKARVIYATATGATDISHLAYMSRLGLWGMGTAFPDHISFIEQMQERYIIKLLFAISVTIITMLPNLLHTCTEVLERWNFWLWT